MSSSRIVSQHRTQLYLPTSLYQKVKYVAQERNISMAEFIRSTLEEKFSRMQYQQDKRRDYGWMKLRDAAGLGESGLSDVSEKHDDYLANGEVKSWKKKR
jgi:hypothetical protein